MNKERETLEKYLTKRFEQDIIFDKKNYDEFIDYVHDKHNLDFAFISDAVNGRISLSACTDFELFALLQGLIYMNLAPESQIAYYFTEMEIETYSAYKIEVEDKSIFPVRIKAVEVTYNQWIGSMTIKELMQLRNKQLLNYNINAQRSMTRAIRGDREYYKITLNKKAVSNIRLLFESGEFISNTITLNIPNSPDSEYYYDQKASELVIENVDHFDISDGYHRFIAACQAYDNNPDFDYPMEVRVVSFENDKIKKFIFQEDQKTKMSRVNSQSMDTSKLSNIITEKLATNMVSDLNGWIRRDSSNYNYAQVSYLIDFYFTKELKKLNESEKRKTSMEMGSRLLNDFNAFLDTYPEYLEKGTWKNIAVILAGFKLLDENPREMITKIKLALEKAEGINIVPSNNGTMKIKTANDINKLYRDD